MLEAIGEAGVAAPGDALVVRQMPRALRLEVEEALRERFAVVRRPGLRTRDGREREEDEEEEEEEKGGATLPEKREHGGVHAGMASLLPSLFSLSLSWRVCMRSL